MALKLIDGKFFDGDKEVPLEFGNKEQIHVMNQHLSIVTALAGEGLEVNPDIETIYRVSASFKCPCGCNVSSPEVEIDDEDPFDAMEELNGKKANCKKCGKKYVFSKNEDGDLVVKYRNV